MLVMDSRESYFMPEHLTPMMQGFIEGTFTEIMPWQIDVRDIGRAHVRAAEVGYSHPHPPPSLLCGLFSGCLVITTAGRALCESI